MPTNAKALALTMRDMNHTRRRGNYIYRSLADFRADLTRLWDRDLPTDDEIAEAYRIYCTLINGS